MIASQDLCVPNRDIPLKAQTSKQLYLLTLGQPREELIQYLVGQCCNKTFYLSSK